MQHEILSTLGRRGTHAWGDLTSGIEEQSLMLSRVAEPGNLGGDAKNPAPLKGAGLRQMSQLVETDSQGFSH
ncbi:MAG TPA: hypothetical protein V6C90_03855 [Coleofasciculaceae cyanobacterium]|jgi:hypothetical protein